MTGCTHTRIVEDEINMTTDELKALLRAIYNGVHDLPALALRMVGTTTDPADMSAEDSARVRLQYLEHVGQVEQRDGHWYLTADLLNYLHDERSA